MTPTVGRLPVRLVLLRATCDNGRTCPNIKLTDRGTYLVQGYVVTAQYLGGHSLRPGEAMVEVPSSLLPELAANQRGQRRVHRTAQGTLLVRGRLVVDVETLRALDLPAGEAAVEIPINGLPELELAYAR